MCVVSMVADQFNPWRYPQPQPYVSQNFDWLKIPNTDQRWTVEKWQEFEKLLEQVKLIDELTGQPDCEDAEKVAWMNEVRRALGLAVVEPVKTLETVIAEAMLDCAYFDNIDYENDPTIGEDVDYIAGKVREFLIGPEQEVI